MTSTGVCITAPVKTPAARAPINSLMAATCVFCRGVASTRARDTPRRVNSPGNCRNVPAPNTTRIGAV